MNHSRHGVGSVLGRYVVAEVIGEGGMGAVYRAFDPELRRDVALKVIRVRSRDAAAQGTARMRLLREAQTMAQLNHPNVVPVFDVGVAPMLVFVAMELVRGGDLRMWLGTAPRTTEEVIDAFTEAGRGLVAAHAVGVVHRDFKPSNVLVDGDGALRIRVTDFGLARIMGADDSESLPDDASPQAAAVLHDLRLTDAGMVIGTVAYMAPEQHQGRPADPRSDQFAFAAALWEALADARPYPQDSVEQAYAAKLAGPPPSPTTLPRWLAPILARALAPDPGDRFASMQAMLDAIERRGHRRSRVPLVVGAVTVATMIVAAATSVAATPTRCPADVVRAPWTEADRDRLHNALGASQAPYADDARTGALAGLDRWSAAWSEDLTAICDAAPGDRDAEALLGERLQCLEQQRASFIALAHALADGGDRAARGAVDAVATLPGIERCRDAAAVHSDASFRDRGPDADAIAAVRTSLAQAAALHRAGRYDDAMVIAKAARTDAEAIDYPALRARAWSVLGSIAIRVGDLELARDAMQTAYFTAASADDADTAVVAALEAISIAGMTDDAAAARMWSEHAASQVARLGSPPHLEAERLAAAAFADWIEGTHAAGLASLERARVLAEDSIDAGDPLRASIENQIALFLDELGRDDEALAHLERAIALRVAAVGEHHPDVANLRVNLGMQLLAARRLDEAGEQIERAVAIDRAALRPGHPNLATAIVDLGIVRGEQGKHDEAVTLHREGLAIRQAELPADHPDIGASHFNLGTLLRTTGQSHRAVEHLTAALAIEEHAVGPDDVSLLETLTALADAERDAGADTDASRHLERARVIAATQQG